MLSVEERNKRIDASELRYRTLSSELYKKIDDLSDERCFYEHQENRRVVREIYASRNNYN
jgi:hypothetical protein